MINKTLVIEDVSSFGGLSPDILSQAPSLGLARGGPGNPIPGRVIRFLYLFVFSFNSGHLNHSFTRSPHRTYLPWVTLPVTKASDNIISETHTNPLPQ